MTFDSFLFCASLIFEKQNAVKTMVTVSKMKAITSHGESIAFTG